MARSYRDLYLLLLICSEKDFINRDFLISFVMLMIVFNSKANMKNYYNEIIDCKKQSDFEYNIKRCLFASIQKGELIIPPPKDVFEKLNTTTQNEDWCGIQKKWSPPEYLSGLNQIWYWDQNPGRNLLLYVCRKYIDKYFAEYDPADSVWNEENRPWDYDHIFPQNWVISGTRK